MIIFTNLANPNNWTYKDIWIARHFCQIQKQKYNPVRTKVHTHYYERTGDITQITTLILTKNNTDTRKLSRTMYKTAKSLVFNLQNTFEGDSFVDINRIREEVRWQASRMRIQ